MADTPRTGSLAGRLGMASVGGALIGFAVWLTLRNLSLSTHSGFIFWVPITLWLLTMGVLCLWSVLLGDRPASRGSIQASWRVGWIVGGIGLAIGFVGPLVIYPKASLGPLLGILLTGPLGFVVGALGAGLARVAHGSR
jgi:hypothetical protein